MEQLEIDFLKADIYQISWKKRKNSKTGVATFDVSYEKAIKTYREKIDQIKPYSASLLAIFFEPNDKTNYKCLESYQKGDKKCTK